MKKHGAILAVLLVIAVAGVLLFSTRIDRHSKPTGQLEEIKKPTVDKADPSQEETAKKEEQKEDEKEGEPEQEAEANQSSNSGQNGAGQSGSGGASQGGSGQSNGQNTGSGQGGAGSQTTPTYQVPKQEAIPGQHRNPNSAVVVIDPGHQLRGDSTKEPNGPGSSVMKARVTSGTTGVQSRVAEYILNLQISLKLRTELVNRGYTVYMTREVHEINISNKERAEYATKVGADIAVRIHANGSTNRSICGAEAYVPSANNPYVSHLAKASQSLGQCILNGYCNACGGVFKNRGVFGVDNMTGMNWSTVPVAILEMGYMSNPQEDMNMQDATIQNNMVQGIANGIDAYFGF